MADNNTIPYSSNGTNGYSSNGKANAPTENIKKFKRAFDFKNFVNLLRENILPISLIFLTTIIVTVIYVSNLKDIYQSTVPVKVNKPQGSVLEKSVLGTMQDQLNERFILNEIEVLKSFDVKNRVAKALLDSFRVDPKKDRYFYLVNQNKLPSIEPVTEIDLRKRLAKIVKLEPKRGVDVIYIMVEDPSFYEAQMISNVYASTYLDYSLELNRKDLKSLKDFLGEEKDKKFSDLRNSEQNYENFLKGSNVVSLDKESEKLVDNISDFEANKNAAEIELSSKQKANSSLKNELARVDPSTLKYFESEVTQPYLTELQKSIADLEIKRDVSIADSKDPRVDEKIKKENENRLNLLKRNLNEKLDIVRSGLNANTPADRRDIANKILNTEIDIQSLRSKINSLNGILKNYEAEFSSMPEKTVELAKIERDRKSTEKLYLALEEKYQEANINERSTLGYALVLDPGVDADKPVKPDRPSLYITGILIGLALAFGFVYFKNYFDRTIKTPEEVENLGLSVLSWIPAMEELKDNRASRGEFVVHIKPNSQVSEAFKALRTRIQYAKLEEKPIKKILITSSIPSEGKTTVALNLAGSIAQSGKKVLLIDCDLRKPRIHNIFETERTPGLSDYLFGNVHFEDIVRQSPEKNLEFITSGTIPPNPSELLGSVQMKKFLDKVSEIFDIVLIDSPPFISVTDAEILFRITDGAVLVLQSNKTPVDAFIKTYERLYNLNSHNLLGCVLNNFSFKSVYGYYYYNYYYYYSRPDNSVKKEKSGSSHLRI